MLRLIRTTLLFLLVLASVVVFFYFLTNWVLGKDETFALITTVIALIFLSNIASRVYWLIWKIGRRELGD